jgi:hypothetical protein
VLVCELALRSREQEETSSRPSPFPSARRACRRSLRTSTFLRSTPFFDRSYSRLGGVRFLIHDRDAKFCGPFDAILVSEGVRVTSSPAWQT